jgi:hypothetical protein
MIGRRAWVLAAALLAGGCATPALSQSGQLVFSEKPQHGATVLTANGVEFVDKSDRPRAVVRTSAFEPWRPPTGFLLPADGILRATSTPVVLDGKGVRVVLRASDGLVPAWGGEILLRLDALVPAPEHPEAVQTLRAAARVAIVLDADTTDAVPLVEDLLDSVGAADRVSVFDSAGGVSIVPAVPGTHRSLLAGAAERRLAKDRSRTRRDLASALARAGRMLGSAGPRRLLLLSDGRGVLGDSRAVRAAATKLDRAGVRIAAVGVEPSVQRSALAPVTEHVGSGDELARVAAIDALLAPPGDVVVRDLELSFSSAPAPLRLLESSSGEITSTLEDERLDLGDLSVGEARTEVVRLGIVDWQAGDELRVRVRASWHDAAGNAHSAKRELRMLYSEDIEAIARQRRGDVIAYASALAMVRRLERAFLGSQVDHIGGLEGLVRWQARSLTALARTRHDAWLAGEAEVLDSLLDALGPS